jgi:hypothetical protein
MPKMRDNVPLPCAKSAPTGRPGHIACGIVTFKQTAYVEMNFGNANKVAALQYPSSVIFIEIAVMVQMRKIA